MEKQGADSSCNQTERFLLAIYGDSLSLPRQADGVNYWETYPELMKSYFEQKIPNKKIHLYNRGKGDITIEELYKLFVQDQFYFGVLGDVVIFQCGIVDCAPRPVSPRMRRCLAKMPKPVLSVAINFLHKYRHMLLRSGLLWRITPPARFKQVLKQLLEIASQSFKKVYVINICPTIDTIEAHSPGLSASIYEYNRLISEIIGTLHSDTFVFIDINHLISESDQGILSYINAIDGHHITKMGHRLIYKTLLIHESYNLDVLGRNNR